MCHVIYFNLHHLFRYREVIYAYHFNRKGTDSSPGKDKEKFHLDAQSKIEWVVEGNTIRVIPIPKDPVKAFEGSLKGSLDFKKFIEDRKKERKFLRVVYEKMDTSRW